MMIFFLNRWCESHSTSDFVEHVDTFRLTTVQHWATTVPVRFLASAAAANSTWHLPQRSGATKRSRTRPRAIGGQLWLQE